MDKIRKFLKKLSKKEREAILLIMAQLMIDYRKIPGIVAIQSKENYYRIRVGKYRIIFEKIKHKIEIKRIIKRDKKTYTDL